MRSKDASAQRGVIRALGNDPRCSVALSHQLIVLLWASSAGDAAWGPGSRLWRYPGMRTVPGAALGALVAASLCGFQSWGHSDSSVPRASPPAPDTEVSD